MSSTGSPKWKFEDGPKFELNATVDSKALRNRLPFGLHFVNSDII